MSKIRIYELAKQLGVANKDLMEKIHSVGIEAKSHMAMLTEEEAAKVTALYQPKKEEPKKEAPKKKAPKKDAPKQEVKKDAPKQQHAPKQDAPKKDAPKKDAPKQ
ncbi:translation initiation factor IF-2 N-terminal domain-containing protein, partial [Anaerotignum sp.]